MIVTLLAAFVPIFVPETESRKVGGLAVLIPHVAVPAVALSVLVSMLLLTVATCAVSGFYVSPMPSFVAPATGIASPSIGPSVVSIVMAVAVVTMLVLRPLSASQLLPVACGVADVGVGGRGDIG